VAFSPDGETLASASLDKTIRLWDVATGQERAALKGHTNRVHTVAFSPDGKTLASGSGGWDAPGGGFRGEIKLWDVQRGQERATLQDHTGGVYCLAFSPDGKTLAGAGTYRRWWFPRFCFRGEIKLWDLATGQERITLQGHAAEVDCLTFSPDGQTLASSGRDHTVRLWDVFTGQERARLKGGGPLAYSPDGKTLASGSQLRDAATGQERATLRGPRDAVHCLAFSPDGKTLAGGLDQTIKLWEARFEP
jgi:WD40 repeat protein